MYLGVYPHRKEGIIDTALFYYLAQTAPKDGSLSFGARLLVFIEL